MENSKKSVSPVLLAALGVLILIAAGLYAYSSKAGLGWKTYTSNDGSFSLKYPKELFATTDDSIPSSRLVAFSTNANYTVEGDTQCSANYFLTTNKHLAAWEDFKTILNDDDYASNPELTEKTISGHNALILTGTSDAKKVSALYAPAGSPVYMAFLDNGDDQITLASCGATADKAEFNKMVSSFDLKGTVTSPTPTARAVQEDQSKMRSRDAVRGSELNNLGIAAAKYYGTHQAYPIHTACTPVDQLKTELVTDAADYFDPKADTDDAVYTAEWPNYCYQSDAQGTKFTIWAKTEHEANAGLNETFDNSTPAPAYFDAPAAYKPNATYAQAKNGE